MPPTRASAPEPPISVAADGRVVYRPMLSADEGYGAPVFDLLGPHERHATEVVLIAPEDFDGTVEITDGDRAAAASIDEVMAPLRPHFEAPAAWEGEAGGVPMSTGALPELVDHRPHQSAVKHQGRRNTCVAHAAIALLEAMSHIPDDLSEQYAHYKFMGFLNLPQSLDRALLTPDAARFLGRADGLVSDEAAWPYIADQAEVVRLVEAASYGPPQRAIADQTYGYATYKLIDAGDGAGESICNPQYLEALLAAGFDIAVGSWVSWNERENTSVMGLVSDPATGGPYKGAGHAMLIVGYDRPHQYFILKNSWGAAWGHAGYGYFAYDFARAGFKYGFTVSAAVPSA
jgi:papain like protease